LWIFQNVVNYINDYGLWFIRIIVGKIWRLSLNYHYIYDNIVNEIIRINLMYHYVYIYVIQKT
jgi:hypothetical protein